MPRGTSRFDEARHQMRLWTPAHLTTKPVAWYDAQDLATITTATGVSQWSDKSGNGRHVSQATGSKQPAYAATGFGGGLPGLNFDGSDDFLTQTTLTGFPNNSTGFFPLAAIKADAFVGHGIIDVSSNGVNTNTTGLIFLEGNILYVRAGGSGNPASVSYFSTAANLVAGFMSVAKRQVWTNGTLQAENTVSNTALTSVGLRIGALFEDIYYFDGHIGEVLVLSGEPSAFDRQRAEGYLAHRWGLTANLPASHPYRTAPPLIGT